MLQKTIFLTWISFFIFPNSILAQTIDLLNFSTETGECSVAQKNDLQESFFSTELTAYKSYTDKETAIEMRRGASPTTGKFIKPLETVLCLKKDGNKMLVTSTDPLDKSCGWVKVDHLTTVSNKGSLLGSNMAPCGEIEPVTVGEFCSRLADFGSLSPQSLELTRFCGLNGLINATIDAKFVTDNTTSRLLSSNETSELVKKEIPVFLESGSETAFDKIEIFSMTEIYDVTKIKSGDIRILLGVGDKLKGWADISSGHIWYSNLATYFSKNGNGKVYLGDIISAQPDPKQILAEKPPTSNFDVKEEYVKFPVLFDMRARPPKAPPTFQPQLKIAFIGKFCEDNASAKMCTDDDNLYNKALSNLRSADVVFLIDGSKSMRQYFQLVAESLSKFTSKYYGNPDYRFGVAMYGDFINTNKKSIGDPMDFRVIRALKPIVSNRFNDIANTELFIADALKDKAEAVHSGVFLAANSFDWEDNKPHFIIHIADHGDRINPTNKVYDALSRNNIFYIPIAVEGEGVIKESSDFIKQASLYSKNYKSLKGNTMAVSPIVTYGSNKKGSARDKIASSLVEATNVVSIFEGQAGGDTLPTLGPAVRDIFKIPSTDDIDVLAAVGNIPTAPLLSEENNWDYFVALDRKELNGIKKKAEEVCATLGSGGDEVEIATDAIVSIVKLLTGDDKTAEELVNQLLEGSIPLQTQTIIGDGMRDFLRRAAVNDDIEIYKKEFCRTETLLDGIQRGKFIKRPEEGQDIIWNGDFYDRVSSEDFKWKYTDDLGRDIYYLPLSYLPRPKT